MASREHQGLQIALIIFVMITIALAVTTYFFFRQADERATEVAAARESEQAARQAADIADFENQMLKHFLGYRRLTDDQLATIRGRVGEELQEIEEQYNRDMSLFGAEFGEEKSYMALPGYLIAAIRQRNEDVMTLTAAQRNHAQEMANLRELEEGRTGEALEGQRTAAEDLASERSTFQEQLARIQSEAQEHMQTYSQRFTQWEEEKQTLQADMRSALDEGRRRDFRIQEQEERIREMQDVEFEEPDGSIVRVDQRRRLAWIDLGHADGLRRGVVFGVFDMDEISVGAALQEGANDSPVVIPERKARLEVVRVMDDHMSEARIIDHSVRNPILPGDQVFSPAWTSGRRVHFALAGEFDLNDDGQSDLDVLRNLITMNGAVVDAVLMPDGTLEGQLSSHARYLVIDGLPTEADTAEYRQQFTRLVEQARQTGAEVIEVGRMLGLLGWRGEVRTTRLGPGARPEDFREERRPAAGDRFRQRTPTRGSQGGAY